MRAADPGAADKTRSQSYSSDSLKTPLLLLTAASRSPGHSRRFIAQHASDPLGAFPPDAIRIERLSSLQGAPPPPACQHDCALRSRRFLHMWIYCVLTAPARNSRARLVRGRCDLLGRA